MSTTDTKAAFEYWFSDEGAHPKAIERSSNGGYILAAASHAWNVWQAATEAAKATGTAELPSLPEGKAWASPLRYGSKITFPKPVRPDNWDDDDGVTWFCNPYFTADQMREYGKACAEAAAKRSAEKLAAVWADIEKVVQIHKVSPCSGDPIQDLYDLLAARQPAPALPVKPWEARMQEYFAQGSVKMRTPASFMADEIIDWRAALAATAAPVLSGKPKEGEKGWRPACCDGGGEGSPCCDFGGCAANNELAEMREEANRSQP